MALPPNCRRIPKEGYTIASKALESKSKSVEAGFAIYDDAFLEIVGSSPSLKPIAEQDYSFAHEAPVWDKEQDAVFFTSNILRSEETGEAKIETNRITRQSDGSWSFERLDTGVVMGNGAINYPAEGGILFCAQGNTKEPGGIVLMQTKPPYSTRTLVDSFHGRLFNSVNDIVLHTDGSIWWTDPSYGYTQGFRSEPQLPNQVYRFDPRTGDLRVVADGIGKPNGLCFSPDEKTMYVTDTNCFDGIGGKDFRRPSTIYAFDVIDRAGAHFLANRRVFAFADDGVPDGIKCDLQGFVYSGCGDGVQVWHPSGKLVGKILVPGGVANFCFTRKGEMILLNENRIWEVKIEAQREGALLANLGIHS